MLLWSQALRRSIYELAPGNGNGAIFDLLDSAQLGNVSESLSVIEEQLTVFANMGGEIGLANKLISGDIGA